jgi:formate hydrogenlyase transcriptional activator
MRKNGSNVLVVQEEHLAFEGLVCDLLARFLNVRESALDSEIEDAIRQIAEFLDLEQGLLVQWGEDARPFPTHSWTASWGTPPPLSPGTDMVPWVHRQAAMGKVVMFSCVDDLPEEAEKDKQFFLSSGRQSLISLPMKTNGEVIGALVFASLSAEKDWPDEIVRRLRLVAQVFTNALARKRSDSTLHESEERLRLATESAEVGLWDLAVDSGHLWMTGMAREVFGFPPDSESTLERILTIVHPEDRQRLRAAMEETIETGKDTSIEYRITRPDGGIRWIFSRSLTYPATQCRSAHVMGLSLDITERKKAEATRTESTERFRAMVEAYDGFIYICGQDYRIEFMNRHLIDRTGRDAVGELCHKALHDRDTVCPWCVNERVFAGETVRWEVQSPKDSRWYYVVNTPIRHCGGTFSKQSIIMDITDRKQTEQKIRSAYEEIKELKDRLEVENVRLREEINRALQFEDIIGQSDAMKYVFFRVQQVAPTDSTVLITGETGTGKGLIARAIHSASQRRDRQMIIVNCAALPSSLIESELFGKEKGAFTGAHTSQAGRFELADKGTLFLDEIGDLPLELQAKLLRAIENGEFERLGSPRTIKVDVRIIASTNRDLENDIREGRFREDLFYRLNVFPVTMPPLRQRSDDIPLLVRHFVKKHGKIMGKNIKEIPRRVMKALETFPWPGNVRELENIVERAVISTEGRVLELAESVSADFFPSAQNSHGGLSDVEREHILKILNQTSWKIEGQKGAAKMLGLKPSTLRSRMKKLGIQKTKSR